MARPFLSLTYALATASLLAAGATRAVAQAPTPTAPTAPTVQAKKYPEVQEAIQLLVTKRDMQGALDKLREAGRKYPELPSPHVFLWQFFAQIKEPNAARMELELAVKNGPSDPEPYVILGNVALQERRVAEATMDFDKAKQLLAGYTNADRKGTIEQQVLSGTAQMAEIREEWKEAEKLLRDLLKLAPEDLNVHQRLARCLFWQTKAAEAYDMLKKAKEIDRANAKKNNTAEKFLTPEAIMGKYYEEFEGRKSANSEKWFTAALKMAPNDLPTREVVALWALDRGKLDFVKEQAKESLRIEESDPKKYAGSNVGHILRGVVALWEKDWPEAENNFQKVIYESPTDFVARNNIALALVEQDDPAKKNKALTYAEANYRDNQNSPDAISTLGWVRFKRQEFDQASSAFDQVIKAMGGNVNNPDIATEIAHILYHQDKKWQTKELLDTILKGDRPFSMKPEALKLYEKVKDATKPAAAEATPPATPSTAPKTP